VPKLIGGEGGNGSGCGEEAEKGRGRRGQTRTEEGDGYGVGSRRKKGREADEQVFVSDRLVGISLPDCTPEVDELRRKVNDRFRSEAALKE
jgi:hypothetical protein